MTRQWDQYEPFAIRGIIRSGVLTRAEARDLYAELYFHKNGGKFVELLNDAELLTELEEQF